MSIQVQPGMGLWSNINITTYLRYNYSYMYLILQINPWLIHIFCSRDNKRISYIAVNTKYKVLTDTECLKEN